MCFNEYLGYAIYSADFLQMWQKNNGTSILTCVSQFATRVVVMGEDNKHVYSTQ